MENDGADRGPVSRGGIAPQPLFAVGAVLITRAPPGPFAPAPFGFAKGLLRKCGVSVS